jgi:hypothetical protein
MMATRARARVCAAVIAVAVPMLFAGPASAHHDVRRSGDCSRASTWSLRAEARDWRIEVKAEVESHVNGQTWTWRILHNGGTSAHGTKRTNGGSFEVERSIYDADGTDRIGWRAHNAKTGESCKGSLTI